MKLLSPSDIILISMRVDTSRDRKTAELTDISSESWYKAVEFANLHEILGLLSPIWRDISSDVIIPEGVLRSAQAMVLRNRVRTGRMLAGLSKILTPANQANVPVIVLKGAHLVSAYYDDIGYRPMSDLDLLIKPEDLDRIEMIMHQVGFIASPNNEAEQLVGKHLHYHHPRTEVSVEVHWRLLTSEFSLETSLEPLWKSAIPIQISGKAALGLPPEIMLPLFALHLFNHRFRLPIRQVWDAAVVIQKEVIDWRVVIELAGKWKMERSLASLLFIIGELWGVPLPKIVNNFVAESGVISWKETLFRNILQYQPEELSMVSPRFMNLLAVESSGFTQKIQQFIQILLPPPEWMSMRYRVAIRGFPLFITYLRRLIQLPLDYGKIIWNLIRGGAESRRNLLSQKTFLDWLQEN